MKKKNSIIRKILIIAGAVLLLYAGFCFYCGHNLNWLSEYGIDFNKKFMSIEFSEVDAGRDATYYYVVKMTKEEKEKVEADWREMSSTLVEVADFQTGLRFLKGAGETIPEEYIPDFTSLHYRYHYIRLEDGTNLTVIDPVEEDRMYIMLVQF